VASQDASDSLTRAHGVDSASSRRPLGQVLIVVPDDRTADAVGALFRRRGAAHCERALSIDEARSRLRKERFELVVLDLDLAAKSKWSIPKKLRQTNACAKCVVLGERASYDDAIAAIRAGAADYLLKPLNESDAETRLWNAFEQAMHDRQREWSIKRLKRICKRLNNARLDVTAQIDDLCNDLVGVALVYVDPAPGQTGSVDQIAMGRVMQ